MFEIIPYLHLFPPHACSTIGMLRTVTHKQNFCYLFFLFFFLSGDLLAGMTSSSVSELSPKYIRFQPKT